MIDRAAYTSCVLEALWRALRRRDVYAIGADKWGDPRARLLDDTAWSIARPRVLQALDLPAGPAWHLAELAGELDQAWRQVADGLSGNTAVQVSGGGLHLERLGPEPEPPGMAAVRQAVSAMLPEIDYPELILEAHAPACSTPSPTSPAPTPAWRTSISPRPPSWCPNPATSA